MYKTTVKLLVSYLQNHDLLFFTIISINFIIGLLTIVTAICGSFNYNKTTVFLTLLIGILLIISASITINLHNLSKPRSIKNEEAISISKKLKENQNSICIVRAGSYDEIQEFSDKIASIFYESGWQVTMSDGPEQISKNGIIVLVFDYSVYCTKALFIKKAFKSAGIDIDCQYDNSGNGNKDDIILYITKKPIKTEQCN